MSSSFKDIKISKKFQARIDSRTHKKSIDALIERSHEQTIKAKNRTDLIRLMGKKEFLLLKNQPLFLVGISLYWAKITGVSKNNFIKTCCSKNVNSKGKINKKSLPYGTIHIRINDVKLFFRVIGWIEGLKVFYKV